mmetsp:Transcript_102007/g.304349  ORF Transcript_102007/g.304349 Transcript_102007/m.304349 type:complete len:82 (-) Transcript_102007:862-1107(-)
MGLVKRAHRVNGLDEAVYVYSMPVHPACDSHIFMQSKVEVTPMRTAESSLPEQECSEQHDEKSLKVVQDPARLAAPVEAPF